MGQRLTAARRLGISMVCSFLAMAGLPMIVAPTPAAADFGAGQAARYNNNLNGDYLLIGNTVLKCNGGSCTTSGVVNDDLEMDNNDPDGAGGLFNGSNGTFTIPSGAVVDAAFLYWGGNLGTTRSSFGNTTYYCADNHDSVDNSTADKSTANTVQMKVGGGSYVTYTADTIYTNPTGGLSQSLPSGSSDDGLVYEGVKDVTAALASVGGGAATTVSVGNIQTMQGSNCHAGWALAVVYRFPALNCLTGETDNAGGSANRRNDYRNVAIYDGLLRQQDGASDTTTTLSGFLTAQPGPNDLRLGVLAWEGDQYLDEDEMRVKSNLSGSATAVNPAGPSGTDNYFDSGKQPVADHNADLDTNPDSGATIQQGYVSGRGDGHGIDAKTQVVQVPGGTSAVDVTFTTDSDQYYPGGFALSSPLKCLLIVEKDQAVNGTSVPRDNATSPAPYVTAGDVITYTMPIRVAGDVDLSSVSFTDAIPAGTSYVAGSLQFGKGNTAAAALGALAAGGSFSAGTVTANLGTLNNPSGATCPAGELCYAAVRFQVTVNAGTTPGTTITNTAKTTFTASGIPITEVSNPVTDKVGALLTVSKSITGSIAGDPTTFQFAVVCNGNAVTGSPFSLANGASKVLPVPPGATCSVTETTSPNFAVSASGAITTNGGSTTMTQDRSVAFTNARSFGKIRVAKTTNAVAGDPVAGPTFEFTVACPGVAGYPRTLNISGSGNADTPSDIPFGTNCTVTETVVDGWQQSSSVSVSPVNEATETAPFTNTRQTGSLQVNKTTVGGDGTFQFTIDCDGTAWDTTRTVTTTAGAGQSTLLNGVPTGIGCTVTETAQVGWTQTSGPAGAITIQAGPTANANFTNTRQTSDLVITKAVSGTYAIPVSGTFPFTVNCGAAGTFTPSITASNTTNGTTTISGIPVGTTCTVTETVPSGWTLDSSVPGNTNGRQITIATQGNTVTFTNTRDVGTITIDKSIDQGSGTFRFAVTCAGTPVAGSPFDITINAPSTTGSATIENIPTGSSCVVDEDPNGGTSGEFAQVTPAANGTVSFASTGATQTATFVNHRKVGDLEIRKVFPQGSLGDPNQVFTFQWDCGPQPRTIGLKAGETHTVNGLPTGTSCTVSETVVNGYTPTYEPAGGAITIAEGANTVTVTNTRDAGTIEIRKVLSPSTDPGRFDLNLDGGAAEAASVGDGGTTGAITVPTGSHTLAETVAPGNGANAADYTTTIVCLDTRDQSAVDVTQDSAVVVEQGATVVCTYTNTRKTGSLTLTKIVVDPLGGSDAFNLLAGTTTVASGGNGASGTTSLNTGQITVSETGANLADYRTAIECTTNGQPLASANATSLAISVGADADVVCTFTNTRRTGTLEVRKALEPADDPGRFNLLIDGNELATAVGDGGTTGAVTVAPGSHTVDETASAGIGPMDYFARLQCVDSTSAQTVPSEGGAVQVAEGANVVCTFTNTRTTGTVLVTKEIVDPLGGDDTFDLLVDDEVVVDDGGDGSWGTATVNTGTVTVSENGDKLADYSTEIVCEADFRDPIRSDSTSIELSIGPDEDYDCTITNTRRTGTLEVRKVLKPASDPGRFDLLIDGEVEAASVGDNGTTGAVTVAAGAHAVAEEAADGTPADDYGSLLVCIDAESQQELTVTDGNVDVGEGADVVCTFTNTRTTGTLTLTKAVVDPLGDEHTFDLLAGTTVIVDDAVDGSTGTETLNAGQVTVSETGDALDGYATSIVCVDDDDQPVASNAGETSLQFQLDPKADVTCTFTNTRRTGTLEVRKALSPADDPGRFDLLIDDVVEATNVGDGGTTGAVTVAAGTHVVAEKAADGTSDDDYAATLVCVDGQGATVEHVGALVKVADGDDVVCTFTNTRDTGSITLIKDVVDHLVTDHTFDLVVDGTVVVDNGADGSSGTTTVNTGTVTVSETGDELGQYRTEIHCTLDGASLVSADGTTLQVPVGSGEDVVCTVTNIRKVGKLQVHKMLSPQADPGLFDLIVDDVTEVTAVGHARSTREIIVPVGTHTVAEAAATGTSMDDYAAELVCVDATDTEVVIPSPGGVVQVDEGMEVSCTFTNTRRTGTVTITKKVIDPLGIEDRFDMYAGDELVVDEAVDGSTGSATLNTGVVTIYEHSGTLADYTTTIECTVDGTPADVVHGITIDLTLTADGEIDCTFTNTRRTGTIEVRKDLVPSTDPGRFDLEIDGKVEATNVGDGGTSGAVTVAAGTHTVAEFGYDQTSMGDYGQALVCVDAETDAAVLVIDGALEVADDQDVVCTFTNTRILPKPADLTITKTANETSVKPGSLVSFTVTVTNSADAGTAHDVVVHDPLPNGVMYVSSTGGVCDPSGTECHLGDLDPGETVSFTITYAICDPHLDRVKNKATVTSPDDLDSPPAKASTPVARLRLEKFGLDEKFTGPGQTLRYEFVVTNTGGAHLTGVMVFDDKIDWESIDCDPHSAGNGQPLSLAPDESATCEATYVTTDEDVAAGKVRNEAWAVSDQSDPACDDWTVPAKVPPAPKEVDLAIDKGVDSSTTTVGSTLVYTLSVVNHGPAPATDIVVTDTVPDGLSIHSATGDGWDCDVDGQKVTCTAPGPLATGATAPAITIDTDVTDEVGDTLTNTAVVGCGQADVDPSNNSDSASTTVTRVLSVTTVVPTTLPPAVIPTTVVVAPATTGAPAAVAAVTAEPTNLATTGGPSATLATLGMALFGVGAVVLRVRRRGARR